jgi:16S rRNA (adenine1518-N6/adenine1519-N6)-dimethyltransferase
VIAKRVARRHESRTESGTPRPLRPARAKKRFGQHFLEAAWADKVAAAVGAAPGETILEIGPGRGAITARLTQTAGRVIAFEIDRDLAAALRQHAPANLTIVEGNVLDLTSDRVAEHLVRDGATGTIRVAGNLPYNIASPILFKLAEFAAAGVPIVDATVMLQREVADRLLAHPGTADYGTLTVMIRHRASVDRLLQLPPGAFRPPPKVHSTVVRLRFHGSEPPVDDERTFARVTRTMFMQRRKTVANALRPLDGEAGRPAGEMLARAGIDGSRRPETLTIAEIARLSDVYARAVL